ncbi:MAG: peptidoglycan-binding protein [Chthoniobacterales bacterium]|nr:peptidoglycan-binding protein [Chthoniobacterales bacterium]
MKSKLLLFFFFACFSTLAMASSITSTQQILTNLGFYHGPIDGSMGSETSAAIRRFQLANHLLPTGTLTPATAEALGLSKNKSYRTKPHLPSRGYTTTLSTPDPKMLADIFVGGPLLAASPAIQIATVQKAQQNLKTLGYYAGPINGIPDANLKAALQAYQKDSHFKRTGRLDKITLMGLDILPGAYQPGN